MKRRKWKLSKEELRIAKDIFGVCVQNFNSYEREPFKRNWKTLREKDRTMCLLLADWHLSQ